MSASSQLASRQSPCVTHDWRSISFLSDNDCATLQKLGMCVCACAYICVCVCVCVCVCLCMYVCVHVSVYVLHVYIYTHLQSNYQTVIF